MNYPIYIRSLTPEQVNQYLDIAGEQLGAVKTLLREDMVLQELAKSPLTLSVMTLAYQGKKVEELPQIGSLEERRHDLFDAYIERMFHGCFSAKDIVSWNSVKNACILGCIGAVLGLLIGYFFKPSWLGLGLLFELIFGLVFGGGKACLQHFTLRLILWIKGFIPWNYTLFLDYATERIFLQKVGGGYVFIHRILLEHFAQME